MTDNPASDDSSSSQEQQDTTEQATEPATCSTEPIIESNGLETTPPPARSSALPSIFVKVPMEINRQFQKQHSAKTQQLIKTELKQEQQETIFIKPPSRPESQDGQLRPQSVPSDELNNGTLDDINARVGTSPSPGLVVTSVAGPLKLFKCELCPFVCLSEAKWSTHVERHTISKFVRRKIYCGGCENIFYEQPSMKLHLIEDHLMGEMEAIELTEFTFKANPFVPSKKGRKRGISIKNDQTLKKPDLIESTELEPRRPLREGQKIFVKSVEVLKRPDLPSPSPSPSPNPPTTSSPNIYITRAYDFTSASNTPPLVCRGGPITFPSTSFGVKTSNSPMLSSPLPAASYYESAMDVDSEPERSQSTDNKKMFIPNVLPRPSQPDPLMPMTTLHLKSIDEVNMLSFNEIQAPPMLGLDSSFNFDTGFAEDLPLNPLLNDTDTILDHLNDFIEQNVDHNFASLIDEAASNLLADVTEKKGGVLLQSKPTDTSSTAKNGSPKPSTSATNQDDSTVSSSSNDISGKPRGRIYVASNLIDPKILPATNEPSKEHDESQQNDSNQDKPRGRIYIASNLMEPQHTAAAEKPRPRIYLASNLLETEVHSSSLQSSPPPPPLDLSSICQDHFYAAAPSSKETSREKPPKQICERTENNLEVRLGATDDDDDADDVEDVSCDERRSGEETVIEEIIVEEVLEPLDLVKEPSEAQKQQKEKESAEGHDLPRRIFVARNLAAASTSTATSNHSSVPTEPIPSSSMDDVNQSVRRSERIRRSGKTGNEPLYCRIGGCSCSFKDQNVLEYHQRCHDDKDSNGFNCPECNEIFPMNPVALHTHLWRYHRIDLELYSCDKCDYKTPLLSRLQTEHFQIHTDESTIDEFKDCGKNSKATPRKFNRNSKGVSLPEERGQKCSQCDLVFSNRSSLRTHRLNLHATAPAEYTCDRCPRSFNTLPALKTHYKKHADEKCYKCPECDYESNDHNSFRRHKMKHSNTGMYACPYCTYTSIQSTTYRRHLETKHTDLASDLLFKCQLCKFVSISQQKYDVHMTKHRLDNAKKDLMLQRATPANSPELIYLNPNVPVNVGPPKTASKINYKIGPPPHLHLKANNELGAGSISQQIQKIPTPPLVHHQIILQAPSQFGAISKTQQ